MNSDAERIAREIVDGALKVHRALGPGLLESVYQICFAHELRERRLHVECEVPYPVMYSTVKIPCGFRVDMLIDGCVVVENKAVRELHPVHAAQLLTYLKLSGRELGFLINWNVPLIRDGIHRLIRRP